MKTERTLFPFKTKLHFLAGGRSILEMEVDTVNDHAKDNSKDLFFKTCKIEFFIHSTLFPYDDEFKITHLKQNLAF